ncbi:MAG: AAA family ATPase [Spirochaetaceae bacterium]|nr:AAA family ATPase [Spirochaetaceae bacterium]
MSEDLFSGSVKDEARGPLADRMRPRDLDEFIGQDHIVGPGRLLRRAIQRDRLSSIILSGPPGTGKTTLARVIANTTSSRFISINAVLAGVQAIRDAVDSAKRERELYDRRTILFVDEVHRWNKSQQDALLPYVENGTIVLIGATTENPFFEVNKALVSRSRVFQLHPLGDDDLTAAARSAVADRERGYGRWKVEFDGGALEHLVKVADGDARSLLNALELAIETSVEPWPPADGERVLVTLDAAEQSIQRRAVLYDRDGDYHYDASSALIKSLRGSDPDAALYWLARMVYAGEDPRFIFRRLLISASEDVGLADPAAIGVVASCAEAYERIGLPEGQFLLAEAALYLATAPKSNSALAYFDALAAVEAERAEVPDHLKDANRDAEGLGHGAGYLYPHAYRSHWTAQQYLPDSLKGAVFYQPGSLGHEARVRDEVLRRRDAQLAAWLSGELDAPSPTASPTAAPTSHAQAASWTARADSGSAGGLAGLRDLVFKLCFPPRHANALVLAADDGLMLREAVRTCSEGSACGVCRDEKSIERLAYAFRDVEELMRPSLIACADAERIADAAVGAAGHAGFDVVVAAGFLSAYGAEAAVEGGRALVERLRSGGRKPAFAFCERSPVAGALPAIVAPLIGRDALEAFAAADEAFFASSAAPGFSQARLAEAIVAMGLEPGRSESYRYDTRRSIGPRDAEAWLSSDSAYGSAIASAIGGEAVAVVLDALRKAAETGQAAWPNLWTVTLA